MPREHFTHFTPEVQETFLAAFEKFGLVQKACDAACVSRQTVNNHRESNPAFSERYDIALARFRESVEREVVRRAVDGWEEPVFSQRLGIEIGTVRKFSDNLLMMLAKRHIPEFRENIKVDAKVSGGVLVVGMTEATVQDWLSKQALENESDPPALAEGSVEVIDAEHTPSQPALQERSPD